MRNWLLLNIVVLAGYGAGFLAVPGRLLELYGASLSPGGELVARFHASLVLGNALVLRFSLADVGSRTFRGVVAGTS